MESKKPFHYRWPLKPVKETGPTPRFSNLIARFAYANLKQFIFFTLLLFLGCSTSTQPTPSQSRFALIATRPEYYSTPKAKYLGTRYKENLDRLIERIGRNPKTSKLQFANNIASVGGIGFFTHSAAKNPDDRFLEVVLFVPEETRIEGQQTSKLETLFSSYGTDLLAILADDPEIQLEKDVAGYGLNFSWRKVDADSSGARVVLERATLYIPKENARRLLKREMSPNELLREATIFAGEGDARLKLVSYEAPELKPDYGLPLQEQTIAVGTKEGRKEAATSQVSQSAEASQAGRPITENDDAPRVAQGKNEAGSAPPTSGATMEPEERAPARPIPKQVKRKEMSPGPAVTMVDGARDRSSPNSPAEVSPNKPPQEITAEKAVPADGPRNMPRNSGVLAGQPASEENRPSVSDRGTQTAVAEKHSSEQIALRQASKEFAVKSTQQPPSAFRPLEGYVIQLSFASQTEAQRWAEILERRGHVVSITQSAEGGSIRVRIGNFPHRSDAERQLQKLRQEGISGIVLNVPQPFLPRAETTPAREAANPLQ